MAKKRQRPIEDIVISEPIIEEVETEKQTVVGTVSNCQKLNIRENPFIHSSPVANVNVSTKLEIDLSESTENWYKVWTSAGIEGYCMKEFIEIE